MPLFLFHLRTPAGLDLDDTGLHFPDLDAAYLEAYRSIPGMAADLVRDGQSPIPYAFVIADRVGTVLLDVPFSEWLSDGRGPIQPRRRSSRHGTSEKLARTQQLVREIQAQAAAMTVIAEAAKKAMQQGWEVLRVSRVG